MVNCRPDIMRKLGQHFYITFYLSLCYFEISISGATLFASAAKGQGCIRLKVPHLVQPLRELAWSPSPLDVLWNQAWNPLAWSPSPLGVLWNQAWEVLHSAKRGAEFSPAQPQLWSCSDALRTMAKKKGSTGGGCTSREPWQLPQGGVNVQLPSGKWRGKRVKGGSMTSLAGLNEVVPTGPGKLLPVPGLPASVSPLYRNAGKVLQLNLRKQTAEESCSAGYNVAQRLVYNAFQALAVL